jgi:hypothetical protein
MCCKSCSVYSITNPKVNLYSPILSKVSRRNSGMRWHTVSILKWNFVWNFLTFVIRAEGTEFVDLLDTLWYVFTNETDAGFETFCRIFKSKGVIILNCILYSGLYIISSSLSETGFNQTLYTNRQEQGGSSVGKPTDGFLHRMHFTKVSRLLVSLCLADGFTLGIQLTLNTCGPGIAQWVSRLGHMWPTTCGSIISIHCQRRQPDARIWRF